MAPNHFAGEWIAAWNSHDLQRILSHYAEGFEMSSPYIPILMGSTSGTLVGKTAVGSYWGRAMRRFPDLRFELRFTCVGTDSMAIHYLGVHGRRSIEVLTFDDQHLVSHATAHYD